MTDRRGFFLVTSMFIILVVAMLARSIIMLGPAQLRLAGQSVQDVRCERAARAGLAYAIQRLRNNLEWKADENEAVADMPGFRVTEHRGEVFGTISDQKGEVSYFAFRFNCHDGEGKDLDGLPDPDPAERLPLPYVSVNNLRGRTEVGLPQGDVARVPRGQRQGVPPATALLHIQGATWEGGGLPAPAQLITLPRRYQRVHRFIVGPQIPPGLIDASVMAAGGIDAYVTTELTATVTKSAQMPKLRSKRGIRVTDYRKGGLGRIKMKDGAVQVKESLQAERLGRVRDVPERDMDFFNLKWSEVPKPERGSVKLKAGTYVLWPNNTLHYYEMTFAEYQAHILANPTDNGTPVPNDFRPFASGGSEENKIQHSGQTVTIRGDVLIEKTRADQVTEFNLIPPQGRPLFEGDKTFVCERPAIPGAKPVMPFLPPENPQNLPYMARYPVLAINNGVLSCPGNLTLLSNVVGKNATLTSEGFATVASRSKLVLENVFKKDDNADELDRIQLAENDPPGTVFDEFGNEGGGEGGEMKMTLAQTLSFYVKKDLKISSFYAQNRFFPLNLQGLIYTWGDFTAYCGNPDATQRTRDVNGAFKLSGALVAYGGDPETMTPGSSSNGMATFYARSALLNYDASKIIPTTGASLPRTGAPLGAISSGLVE